MPYSKKSPRQQDLPKIGNLPSIAPHDPEWKENYIGATTLKTQNSPGRKFGAFAFCLMLLHNSWSGACKENSSFTWNLQIHLPTVSSHLHYLYSHSMILIIAFLIKICNPVDACLGRTGHDKLLELGALVIGLVWSCITIHPHHFYVFSIEDHHKPCQGISKDSPQH